MSQTQKMSNLKQNNIWYKNYFVLIFVIGLPLLVVVACIGLVIYSVAIKDTVVRDDWYMDGKTLYADVSKDKLAYDLQLSAKMMIDDTGKVQIDFADGLKFTYPKQLMVEISHATQIEKDRDFIANLADESQHLYTGQVNLATGKGKYYLMIHDPDNSWRLRVKHDLPTKNTLDFKPLSAFAETTKSAEIH